MSGSSSQTYLDFVAFVKKDSERERSADTRRALGLIFWCFVAPGLAGGTFILLSRMGILSLRWRGSIDVVMVLFPVLYSLQVLWKGFAREFPRVIRQGNLSTALDTCAKEARWRDETQGRLKTAVPADAKSWRNIAGLFQVDLDSMLRRSRYLTVLAGAIFYLLMQGIDTIGNPPGPTTWLRDPETGWVETQGGDDLMQVGGLGLFLILLYLSGSQTHASLLRYQVCARQLGEEHPNPG